MTTYITKAGDMWDSIAMEVYDSTEHTGKLIAWNGEYAEHYVFPAGITLRVPDLSNVDADLSFLPPWRR